jgi:hypothetical protein
MEKHHPAHVGVAGSSAQKAVIPRRYGELGNRPILLSDSWLRAAQLPFPQSLLIG